ARDAARRRRARAAPAEEPRLWPIRTVATRNACAFSPEGLAARRRLSYSQPIAPRPRIRPGLRTGAVDTTRALRLSSPQPTRRRTEGRRRGRRLAHAHVRGADRQQGVGRRRFGRGIVEEG